MITRYPAVAGSFYPNNPGQLRKQIEQLLADAQRPTPVPKALIAPHAGYIYSGPIAATAYNTLIPLSDKTTRVVLLGPSHHIALHGIATPGCEQFQTPLGVIPLDLHAVNKINCLEGVYTNPSAHAREHSLEVHLPFLQTVLHQFQLVPLVVGDAAPKQVAAILNTLWYDIDSNERVAKSGYKGGGGEETVIIISSDLSHYHPYQQARKLDRDTTEQIENLNIELTGEQACGCRAINGLLYAARQHGLRVTTLDLRNSGDTAGGKDQVVGYGAYALH